MLTYQVQQTWRAKWPKTVVSHDLENPPQPPKEVRHQHLKTNLQGLLSHVHILIVSKSNLKLQVFDLFSHFVRTLIIKISSSEEPANSTSIHRVRNGGKLVIFFHPSPKNITERCRSLSWPFFFIIQINSGLFPCNFGRESQQIQINKFGRNALNYLLTSLARAVLGNIGHWWFVFLDLAVLCPHCHEHGPIFPITVLALG